MPELSDIFQYILEEFGRPQGGEAMPADVMAAYATRVPHTLLDFWAECGTGLWMNGYFQLCRPDMYQSLLDIILEGDPDFPPHECALIGFSAFGRLLIWNNKNYMLTVSLYNKIAYTRHLDKKFPVLPPEKAIGTELMSVDAKSYDYRERTEKAAPLFKRALKKLGPLACNECYGFVPAIELGGREVLAELQKRPAPAYFRMVAGLGDIELRRIDTEEHQVIALRTLGAQ